MKRFIPAALICVLFCVGCSGSSVGTIDVVTEIETCRNPILTVDGNQWSANDLVPVDVLDGAEMRGKLKLLSDDKATFTSDSGYKLEYVNEGEFATLDCTIG